MVCHIHPKEPGKLAFLTQRQYPQFTLIQPSIDEENNTMTLYYPPNDISLTVPLTVSSEVREKCPIYETLIWEEYPQSVDLSAVYPEITEFFNTVRNQHDVDDNGDTPKITLVVPHDRRQVKNGVTDEDRVQINRENPQSSYQDYYPGNLISEKSLIDLDGKVQAKTNGDVKLSPRNFRPNMVIADTDKPWDEDDWKKIKIGSHDWLVPCRNVRCQVTTVNLSKGQFEPTHEPFKTMQSFRRIDSGAKYSPCFGMNLLNCDTEFTVKVGDPLEVLQRGEHSYPKVLK